MFTDRFTYILNKSHIVTDGVYRIVYEEVDDSDVKIYCFPSSNSHMGDFEEYRWEKFLFLLMPIAV